ncbi:MAG: hypothetical protein ACJAUP_001068 [Cellvibrionaceae bacterium]
MRLRIKGDLVETGTINSGNVVAGIRLSAANAGWPLIKMKIVLMGGVVVGAQYHLKILAGCSVDLF